MRKSYVSAIFLLFLLLSSGRMPSANQSSGRAGASVTTDSQDIYLQNNYLELVFAKSMGGLVGIIDPTTHTNLIVNDTFPTTFGFWTNYTGYFTPCNADYCSYIHSNDALAFNYSTTIFPHSVRLAMEWDRFYDGRVFDIIAHMSVTLYDDSPNSAWDIEFVNHEHEAILMVDFPVIAGLGQLSTNPLDDYFTYPALSGMLLRDPLHNVVNGICCSQYPGGYQNMQFVSYYNSEKNVGLYIAANDTEGYDKSPNLAADRSRDWLSISYQYFPAFAAGESVQLPYYMILRVFHGNWYTAAQIYKSWAVRQWWTGEGPLTSRSDIPQWLKNTSLLADVLNQYGTQAQIIDFYSDIPPLAASLTSTYRTSPLLFWRGWENGGWIGGQDIFPPTGGWLEFDSVVRGIHQAGGHLFTMEMTEETTVDSTFWDQARQHATMNASGGYYLYSSSVYLNNGTSRPQVWAVMNPDSYWGSVLLKITLTLASHGVDFLQLDGNAIDPFFDYSKSHSNPIGGGNWWFKGYQTIFQTLRQEARQINPNFAFGAEWCAEVYIPYLDAGCNDEVNTGINPANILPGGLYDESLVSFVPLWQSVYHDYTLSYGTITLIDGTDLQYYTRGLGLSLVYGEDNMIETTGPPCGGVLPPDINMCNPFMLSYSRNISLARDSFSHDYLVAGALLPIDLQSKSIIIPATTNAIPYSEVKVPSFVSPSVLGGAWRASDGSIGIVLTSITQQTVNASFTFSGIGLANESSYITYEVLNGNFAFIGSALMDSFALTLRPGSVCLLGLAIPSSPRALGAMSLSRGIELRSQEQAQGLNVTKSNELLGFATQAFYSDNFAKESEFLKEAASSYRSNQTTASASATTATGFTTLLTSVTATSSTSTTMPTPSLLGASVAILVVVAVVAVASIVVIRSRKNSRRLLP